MTFPSLDPLYAGYSMCCVSSHPTPSALFWEADLYGLHHPDYLVPELLSEFCQWKVLAGDLREGRERKIILFLYFLSAYCSCLVLMVIALVRQFLFQIVAVGALW